MKREFLNVESQQRISVLPPYDESFSTIETDSDGRERHVFADNIEAIAGYVTYVGGLLDDGYSELAPWVTMSRGEETIAVRPPTLPLLEVRADGDIQTVEHDTLLDAIYAYNEFAGQRLADGWAFVLPTEGESEPSEEFERIVVHEPESPETIQKEYYQRKTEPHDEFGPEVWYKGGVPHIYDFQVQTEVAGPNIEIHGKVLRGIQTFHDGLSHGPTIIFDAENGAITSLSQYTGPDGKRLTLIFEDGRLFVEAPDGSTADRENRGLWTKFADDGRLETMFDPPDHHRWFKSYDTQGSLLSAGEYDDDGEKIGTWFETDSENRITSVYGWPGVRESITWERLDGTLELRKEFDESERNTVITFHDEDGHLTERRIRLDDDGWECESFRAGSDDVSERATLDEDGRYHGVRTTYDATGEVVSQTKWVHGNEVIPGTDSDLAPIEALFARLHATSSTWAGAHESVTAQTLPKTLEDHLARLYCIAAEDLAQLSTDSGGWTHKDDDGSTLKLKRTSGSLVGATVLRADGTYAAEARYLRHAPGPYVPVHVHVTLYHDDGESVERAGAYRAHHLWDDPDHVHCTRDGWWFEHDVNGRLGRARNFTEGLRSGAADYQFGDDFYDLTDGQPKEAFADFFDEAQALAAEPSSRDGFLAICRVVEQAAVADRERVAKELVPYLQEAIADWPERIRMAPWLWINRLTAAVLPIEALGLVSALSLTASLTGHYLNNRQYPLLLAWLAAYPEDGPAPAGVSLSFRDDVADALRQACEAETDERYHPAGDLDFDETYHLISDDYEVLFGSPLMRNVRVLDASWEPSSRDFYWDYQGILDGRGLRVGDIVDSLPSERLEVLDLWGQAASCTDQVTRSTTLSKRAKERLAGVQELNLGGGHPIGDEAAKQLAAACQSLRALSLWPGQASAALQGYDFDDEDDDVYRLMSDYWNIYGNDYIERLRLTKSGWKALSKMPLERVDLGAVHADHGLGDEVAVELRTFYTLQEAPRIAAWETHFDV